MNATVTVPAPRAERELTVFEGKLDGTWVIWNNWTRRREPNTPSFGHEGDAWTAVTRLVADRLREAINSLTSVATR